MVNVTIGIGDMKVSSDPESLFSTRSLGSCVGIAIYDRVVQVGGLLHFMLPDSSIDPTRASKHPYIFADLGVPHLLESAIELGAKSQRLKVIVAGGAQIFNQTGLFSTSQILCSEHV
jgi:chemotaxis protein CheD